MTPTTRTTTRAAFAVWQDRLAPVFDVSRHLRLVDVSAGEVVAETATECVEETPGGRAVRLAELGVGVLVCGAISQPLQAAIAAQGITVVAFVAGPVDEVVRAWLQGDLARGRFDMPGCCRRRRGGGRGRRADAMADGATGSGGGRRGGRPGGGPGGSCVCSQCGHTEPHRQGEPCAQRRCPRCGIALRRG